MFLILITLISSLAAQPTEPSPLVKADFVIIEKSARTMKLKRSDEVLKTYKIALSSQPVGAKEREGDETQAGA